MFRRVAVAFAFLASAFAGGLSADADEPSKDPIKAPAGSYRLESPHSLVLFAVSHIGLTDYYGRFDRLSGTLTFDPKSPEKSAVDISIDMTSVDTPSPGLVRELISSDVFDAKTFAVATFKSTNIKRTGPDSGQITGDLKLHGISKSVTLDVTFAGTRTDPLSNVQVLGFHATTTIKRTDFGIEDMVWEPLVGDDVKLTIEALFEQETH
ncbi:MAG: polyisoprenoid-binding protein [Proteobacteria bacterium]|nr:polyisoprenoid-binding protein [Pseudomonadota bacterium]